MRFLAAGFVYLLLVAFAIGMWALLTRLWSHDSGLFILGYGMAVAYGGARDSWNNYE